MRLLLQILTLILILNACSDEKNKNPPFVFPPEWEEHQAIWISVNDQWGDTETADSQIKTRLELIKVLHTYVPIKLLTTSDSLASVLLKSLDLLEVDTSRVDTIINSQVTYFLRDPGPIFLSNGRALKMANWQGIDTSSSSYETIQLRKAVDDSLAIQFGYDIVSSPISYDGGGLVANENSVMSIKDYAIKHNDKMSSLDEIENEILSTYGKQQMIWLEGIPLVEKSGLKVDNYWGLAPDGHIDAVARFANDSTILVTTIAEEDKDKNPIAQHDYEIFQNYLKQLKKYRRINGSPFNIVEIPSPDLSQHLMPVPVEYWDEDVLEYHGMKGLFTQEDTILVVPAMNYANFLLTNGAVIVPEYWEEGMTLSEKAKDDKMKSILSKHFPNRRIIGFNAKEMNFYGGGIHCATQQEPKIDKG